MCRVVSAAGHISCQLRRRVLNPVLAQPRVSAGRQEVAIAIAMTAIDGFDPGGLVPGELIPGELVPAS